MLVSFFAFGFVLGVRHALEADHVAAVVALANRSRSLREHTELAGAWGLGHAGALTLLSLLLFVFDVRLPDAIVRGLEAMVGVVLIALGADVLRRARSRGVHLHPHRHEDGSVHLHAHAHGTSAQAHDDAAHRHEHPRRALTRALGIGGLHGLAGSAAVLLIALQRGPSAREAGAFLAAFALGSILGMVLFSMTISLPLRSAAGGSHPALRLLEPAFGTLTIALGCWTVALAFHTVAG